MRKIVKPTTKKRVDEPIYSGRDLRRSDVQVCSRCIYDESISDISFDEDGVCSYCKMHDRIKEKYQTGTAEGERKFHEIVELVKRAGEGSRYDCVIGVSGGTDSSYLIYEAKKLGLEPLAVHYDNTWNTATATQNIRKVLNALDVDLYTHVVNNKEVDDIFRAFFRAGVRELDGATDLALTEVLYMAANEYDVDYIFNGHSFMAEGISPLSNMYFDGAYIRDIHQTYGERPMKTYPLMTFSRFMKWTIVKRIKRIRPLWYIDYSKEDAQELLREKFDWQYYGGHHLENRITQFYHSVYFPVKFGVDQRNNSLSAKVRSGELTREEALDRYAKPPYIEEGLIDYFQKRLNISSEEYERIMAGQKQDFTDFRTYKKRFERLRPLFYLLMQADLVPQSFYEKYCFPLED